MTLKTQAPISNELKLHRIHHQHHHHYHVHHILDNHHIHIQNHSSILSYQQQSHHDHLSHINQHQHRHHKSDQVHHRNLEHQHQQLQYNHQHQTSHQLIQTRGLTHVIAPNDQRDEPIVATNQRQPMLRSKQRSQIRFFLISAFAYILSPIDLIPEMIFGIFGILDDIIFLLMCLFCVAIILLYPLFREVRRTILEKLGLKQQDRKILDNKSF